ncbi:kinase-like domain-containing protein [Mycena amicta]|nr:kinase-like domain-containing protein [Mycena amicta]
MPTENLDARINAPLGEWPGDLDHVDLSGHHLSVSQHASVHTSEDDRLVFKLFYSLTEQDVTPKVARELRMMLLAGEDLSVKVEGRLIIRGKLQGFIMPCETTLDLALPKATKRYWIEQLQSLVRRVHDKGIIHGDLKPDNILVRGDGQLVLCDWAAAQLKAEAKQPHEGTTAYQSGWRSRECDLPLCEADDLYALGVTIWQIWLDRPPFDEDKFEYLEREIADGLKPDLDAVDDTTVRSLIEMYLESAPEGA